VSDHPTRFRSQVFSTSQRLLSSLKLRGLVSCHNRSWDSPLQSLPLARIAHPSRGHMLPCSHPPTCLNAPLEALLPPVSPTSTLSRSRLVPPSTMSSLFTRRSTLPGHSGSPAAKPPRSASFTCFEALLLLRVRSHQPRLPWLGGRYSPGLLPLQSFLRPRLGSSDPPRPESLNTHLRPKTPARDSKDLATPQAG